MGPVGVQDANTHIHHHYHHNSQQGSSSSSSSSYAAPDSSFGSLDSYGAPLYREGDDGVFYEDNNQVKRNTENQGFVPSTQQNFGGESSSSISGFRFPRERGSRNLDFDKLDVSEDNNEEEKVENEDEEKDTVPVEVEEQEQEPNFSNTVKSKVHGFKFAEDRKKRNTDGQVEDQEFVTYVLPVEANERSSSQEVMERSDLQHAEVQGQATSVVGSQPQPRPPVSTVLSTPALTRASSTPTPSETSDSSLSSSTRH